MKFFIDNCLAPRLANALDALDDQNRVIALRERFSPDAKDSDWLRELGKEGDWVVVSGDPRIARGRHEREAWLQSRLTAFFLEPGWTNFGFWTQASKLIQWWPIIVKQAEVIRGAAGFFVPVKGAKLRQVLPR